MKNDLKPLYIVGAGGFGREVIWLAETINESNPTWEIMGFVDDDSSLWDKMIDGYKVYGGLDYLEAMDSDMWCVVAVGNAEIRKRIVDKYSKSTHIKYATLVSPDAKIGISELSSFRIRTELWKLCCNEPFTIQCSTVGM